MRILFSMALIAIFVHLGTAESSAAMISEFEPNQPGGVDPTSQRIELSGMAGSMFDGFVLGIGGVPMRFGTLDRVNPVSGTFDSNGLLVATIRDFIDPAFTVLLVDNTFTGVEDVTDIDLNNDGVADNLSSLGNIHDAIGVPGTIDDTARLYGNQLGGQDFEFTGDEPRLVFRDASVGDWYAINDPDRGQIFDITGTEVSGSLAFDGDPFQVSFGAINPSVTAVPEPSSGVFAIAAVALVAVRRRIKRK